MESLENATNAEIMSVTEEGPSKLSVFIELVQGNKPISELKDPWGCCMELNEALDGILSFMRVSFKSMAQEGPFPDCRNEEFRGAESIMEIASLAQRRLYQYSQFLLSQSSTTKNKKIRAVPGAKENE